MSKVWQELRQFLRRSYTNRQAARKFDLCKRLEQILLIDQTN